MPRRQSRDALRQRGTRYANCAFRHAAGAFVIFAHVDQQSAAPLALQRLHRRDLLDFCWQWIQTCSHGADYTPLARPARQGEYFDDIASAEGIRAFRQDDQRIGFGYAAQHA